MIAVILGATTLGIWITVTIIQRSMALSRQEDDMSALEHLSDLLHQAPLIGSQTAMSEHIAVCTMAVFGALGAKNIRIFYRDSEASAWDSLSPDGVTMGATFAHERALNSTAKRGSLLLTTVLDAGRAASNVLQLCKGNILVLSTTETGQSLGATVKLPIRGSLPKHRLLLLQSWAAVVSAANETLMRSLRETSKRGLTGQAHIAGSLEQAALSLTSEESDLDWALQVNSPRGAQWYYNAYQLDDDRTMLVLGQLAASDVAASILHLTVRSFCDLLVELLGANITHEILLEKLNKLLWRPTQPIGMSCQALLFDRRSKALTFSSAGDARLYRGRGSTLTPVLPPSGMEALGTSPTVVFTPRIVPILPNDRFVLWIEGLPSTGTTLGHVSLANEFANANAEELGAAICNQIAAFGSLLVVDTEDWLGTRTQLG